MTEPPQGEEPQDPRRPASGWGQQPSGGHDGWGPPSAPPAQGSGWGQQPGQYGQPNPYGGGQGAPGQYGAPAG